MNLVLTNESAARFLVALLNDRKAYENYILIAPKLNFTGWDVLMEFAKEEHGKYNVLPSIEYFKDRLNDIFDSVDKAAATKLLEVASKTEVPAEPYYLKQLETVVRRSRIDAKLLETSDLLKESDADIDTIEASHGLSNPYKKANSTGIPTRYFVDEYLSLDLEALKEETALFNDGFICRREMSCVVAGEGSGKSILGNQWAFAGSHGKETLGMKPYKNNQLKTLILNAEDKGIKNYRMYQSMADKFGSSGQNVKWIDETFLSYAHMMKELREEYKAFQFDMIMVQPLYKYVQGGGSLIDYQPMAELINVFDTLKDEFNCHVMFFHHLRKDKQADFGSAVMNWNWRVKITMEQIERGQYKLIVNKQGAGGSESVHNSIIEWSRVPDEMFWYSSGKAAEKIDDIEQKMLMALYNKSCSFGKLVAAANTNNGTGTRRIDGLIASGRVEQLDNKDYGLTFAGENFVTTELKHLIKEENENEYRY